MTTTPTPTTTPAITLTPDRTLVRHSGHSVRYLHIAITAPHAAPADTRAPVHAAFSLDRSGSMGGSKIRLAKEAVNVALGHLGATDRFALVTFDDLIEVVTPATPATGTAIAATREKLHAVDARGSTALCEGWLTACGEIAPASPPSDGSALFARCFLLTDGQANVGETSPAALARHAQELYKRGVRTATFGLGAGFNEELLSDLATAGGGQFYFIEEASQLEDYFQSELGEALEVASRDVLLTLRAPGVRCEPMTAYAVETAGDRTLIRIGDLISDQVVDVVVKLTFPDGAVGQPVDIAAEITEARAGAARPESVRFTFAADRDNDTQPRAVAVDREVAGKYASLARSKATGRNRKGDYQGAERELVGTARNIRRYAHGDAFMLALAEALEREAQAFLAPMDELTRKRAYSTAISDLKGRDSTGRARKS